MLNLPFTLRQLEVFASLASSGSFRRSAELLGISQASVSNQIKTLEEQMGVRLFDRRPGMRPLLTVAGRNFLEDLQAFEQAAKVLAGHRQNEPERDQPVRFNVLVGQGLLDAYIRTKVDRLFAINPLIELEFDPKPPSGSLIRAVERGEYDFALINQRVNVPAPPFAVELAIVRGGVYGHRKFAEGRKLPLSPDELSMLPFMMPRATSQQEREVLAVLALRGIKPRKIVGHSQYYDVMAAMLERGVAVASFTDAILPHAAREQVIQLAPLDNWRLAYFRKDKTGDPVCDQAEAFLLESVLGDPHYPALELFTDRIPASVTIAGRGKGA